MNSEESLSKRELAKQLRSDYVEKRKELLRVAAQAFSRHGFHATSLEDIADRLEVSKPTLYYYVESKDQLLFECVSIGVQMLRETLAEAEMSSDTALNTLRTAIGNYIQVVTSDFGVCQILVGDGPLPPGRRSELRSSRAEVDQIIRTIIKKGVVENAFFAPEPRMAAFTVAGALSWIGRWYRIDGTHRPEQIADECAKVLLYGLVRREPDPLPEQHT